MFFNVHSHVSLNQPVYSVYGPSEAAKQDDDQDNDDQSRKSPGQQEVEQVPTLCVLVIHHQNLPEVHRLGAEFEKAISLQDFKHKNRHTNIKNGGNKTISSFFENIFIFIVSQTPTYNQTFITPTIALMLCYLEGFDILLQLIHWA